MTKCEKTVQALLCRNLNVKLATLLNATSSRRPPPSRECPPFLSSRPLFPERREREGGRETEAGERGREGGREEETPLPR